MKLQHRINKKTHSVEKNAKSRKWNDICMVLLKQSSRSVLWKRCSWKFPKINRKTPVLKCLFLKKKKKKVWDLQLYEKETPAPVFSREFYNIFQNTYFVFDYRLLCKKDVLKNPTKFTTKFMRTAASGISENRPCLAGCIFINVLQNWLKSVFMQSSTDLALMIN